MRFERLLLSFGIVATMLLAALSPAVTSASAQVTAPSVQSSADKNDRDGRGGGGGDDDDDDDDDDDGNWKTGGLRLLTTQLPTMLPGQKGWVGLNWTSTTDVCNVAVTATAPGVTIRYPENTSAFSSLYVNNALAETNLDYTAFYLQVAPGASQPAQVNLTATFSRLPPGKLKKSDDLKYKNVDCSKGSPGGVTQATATLPIASPSGSKVVLQTTTATVPANQPTWVPLSFTTKYAGLSNFRVSLAPPEGLSVVYPGDGTSSGLANDATLPVGGSDAASVRIDASGLAPGSYRVPVTATWTGGSAAADLTLTVK